MQIIKLFPQEKFKSSVNKYSGDAKRRKFSCYNQLISMIFCHINGCKSLRELQHSFNAHTEDHYHLKMPKIKRSTLSDANATANPEIFIESLKVLMNMVAPKFRKEIGGFVNIIDSSPISLTKSRFDDWTKEHKNSRIQGLKLHLGINTDSQSITEFEISDANKNDITISKNWNLKDKQIYIFDKGYYDYNWWHKIIENGSDFVTRAKKDIALNIVKKLETTSTNIISDEVVTFRHRTPRGGKTNLYINSLRKISVHREDKNTPLILLTNRFDLSAQQIADLYKERWQIELFFKWIKQKLKIKQFIGNSRNAVVIQLVTALITYLLLLLYKNACQIKYSLSVFLIHIRETLWHKVSKDYKKIKRRISNNIVKNQMAFNDF